MQVGNVLRAIKPGHGNDAFAAACYRRALAIDPACALAHFGLGEIFREADNLERAKAAYQAAIAADGRIPGFHAALAQVLFSMRQYAWAADACRRAIQLKPQSPHLLHLLGDALFRLGQGERAEACYLRASALQTGRIRAGEPSAGGAKTSSNLRPWSNRFHLQRHPSRTVDSREPLAAAGSLVHAPTAHGPSDDLISERTA